MSSPICEDKDTSSLTMNCLSPRNNSLTRSLTFNVEDSCDSGFESQYSDNETSPSAINANKFNPSVRVHDHGTRKSLFSGKRSRDANEFCFYSKKPRVTEDFPANQTNETKVTSAIMKTAVEKMDRETDIIGDGSRTHSLPTVSGRHKDLKSVSPRTVSQLLEGKYDDVISGYKIIDCRYPYEYEGGHIEGAVNLHTDAMITDLITSLSDSECNSRNILIFHCEFSSERGPKRLRHLRSIDRKLNSDRYPSLCYPEVYLLDGGYKAFYQQNQIQCSLRSYVPMIHEDYSKQLRHFRVKSKSWTAGEKQSMRSRHMMDVSPVKFTLWRF